EIPPFITLATRASWVLVFIAFFLIDVLWFLALNIKYHLFSMLTSLDAASLIAGDSKLERLNSRETASFAPAGSKLKTLHSREMASAMAGSWKLNTEISRDTASCIAGDSRLKTETSREVVSCGSGGGSGNERRPRMASARAVTSALLIAPSWLTSAKR